MHMTRDGILFEFIFFLTPKAITLYAVLSVKRLFAVMIVVARHLTTASNCLEIFLSRNSVFEKYTHPCKLTERKDLVMAFSLPVVKTMTEARDMVFFLLASNFTQQESEELVSLWVTVSERLVKQMHNRFGIEEDLKLSEKIFRFLTRIKG
ncbi:hypothetical protein GQX74_014726 [Glossina fuscipes]|nr:hypothetical protein GQX74_014726 [Glossina fuscipes]